MKKGIMYRKIKGALLKYKKDKDLFQLLQEIGDIADSHIHYAWHRYHFDQTLRELFFLILGNNNPTHRFGDISTTVIYEEPEFEFDIIEGKERMIFHLVMIEKKNPKKKWYIGSYLNYYLACKVKEILEKRTNSELYKLVGFPIEYYLLEYYLEK